MTCPICEHQSLSLIDRALRERTILIASGGKDSARSLEEMASDLNETPNFGPEITGRQLKTHLTCPPPEDAGVSQLATVPAGIVKTITMDGEVYPVYTPAEMLDRICAVAMRNIELHPEQVNVGHLIQIMKLTGDLRRGDDLIKMVQDLIMSPTSAPMGPQAPPIIDG